MRISAWMWLGPLAFLVHDTEEILTAERWLRTHAGALPDVFRPLTTITTAQFSLGVAMLLLGYLAATWHGVRAVRTGAHPLPFLVVTGAFIANGLTHIAQALVLRSYVPGLITAVLVSLPYGWCITQAFLHAGLASRTRLAWMVGLGLVLQAPIALLALTAAHSWL